MKSEPTATLFRNARWLIRGLGAELAVNIGGRAGPPWQRSFASSSARAPRPLEPNNGLTAVVTGATGGIGAEVCEALASLNYDVIIAARSRKNGKALAAKIRAKGYGGRVEFVEVHMDSVTSIKRLGAMMRGRPCAILINNAGVMSVGKDEIIRTNLHGVAALTVSMLPSLHLHDRKRLLQGRHAEDEGTSTTKKARPPRHHDLTTMPPRVVNVGSSSHLRASRVDASLLNQPQLDSDLTAYAQSKLGVMQFSTLMRSALPWLTICDAHPGIVWTPMLQRHWGPKVAPMLEKSQLSRVLFKSPSSGANTILTAALSPRIPPKSWGERARWRRGWDGGQPYFVNRRPNGYASAESRDMEAAKALWVAMLEPVARRAAPAEAVAEVSEGVARL